MFTTQTEIIAYLHYLSSKYQSHIINTQQVPIDNLKKIFNAGTNYITPNNKQKHFSLFLSDINLYTLFYQVVLSLAQITHSCSLSKNPHHFWSLTP